MITVNLLNKNILEQKDTIVFPVFEDYDLKYEDKINSIINDLKKSKEFTAEAGTSYTITTLKVFDPKKIILLGLGKKENYNSNILRKNFSTLIKNLKNSSTEELAITIEKISEEESTVIALTEGSIMSVYSFDTNKSDKKELKLKNVNIITKKDLKSALNYATIVAKNNISARELVNTSACIATPEYISSLVLKLSKDKFKCTIFDKKKIIQNEMNGLIAVNSGSDKEPRFLILEYGTGKKTVCLVGKGLTFDSGGLNIKTPGIYMETMKEDKAGASAVIYAINAIAELKLKDIRVIGLIPLTENMISGSAYKPGDIIKMKNNKTIEVLNTDAEGRIILADALIYSKNYNPNYLIDIATLTGACKMALGDNVSGIMGNDKELINKLFQSGEVTNERIWEFPMYEEYGEMIKGDYADIKNVVSNSGSPAGAITAAKFLEHFIPNTKWAHIDIAGPSWSDSDKEYLSKGATGVGVRLFVDFVRKI